MENVQRLKKFISWQWREHIGHTSAQDTYNTVSQSSFYDGIVDFDTRRRDLETLLYDIPVSGKRVLDIACGSGAFIQAVLVKNPKSVVGVDISEGMLRLARKRFQRNKRIHFIHKSFMEVSFAVNSFDVILLANASRYIPKGQEELFFTNVKKWLKKDGVFIIHSDFWNGIFGKLIAPALYALSNKANTNPNTTFEWNLERELKKYFVVKNKIPIGWWLLGRGQHMAFVCKNE